MGLDCWSVSLVENRRLIALIAMAFALVLVIQYFELPYSDIISSLLIVGKVQVTEKSNIQYGGPSSKSHTEGNVSLRDGLESTYAFVVPQIGNGTMASIVNNKSESNGFVSDKDRYLDKSDLKDNSPEIESSSKGSVEIKNPMIQNSSIPVKESALEGSREPELSPSVIKVRGDDNSSTFHIGETVASSQSSLNKSSPLVNYPSTAVPPTSPLNAPSPMVNLTSNYGEVPVHLNNTSLVSEDASPTLHRTGKSKTLLHPENSSMATGSPLESGSEMTVPEVFSISKMYELLLKTRSSYRSMEPRWSSAIDSELLFAKSQIENAPILNNDPALYAPLYHNLSRFKRSYEIMEGVLKVYVYKEGDKPIFHHPPVRGIYASEGWFMKLLESNKKFITRKPENAHLFYLPFSSRMLEETAYVSNSHSYENLIKYLKNYLDMISAKYSFWNRTGGVDHFLVACHDWAPGETKLHMANCIRALCNSDVKAGFKFGKDVSLPETKVRSPKNLLQDLGGKPPSERKILAFFAGNKLHGYLRPILLKHWENKDPDMKISGKIRKAKGKMSYVQLMKSSKYCICAKGYEVNSPRVVEAIFYECVPVIISDNFVPPFFEILNWEAFAVFVLEKDIPDLKNILLSIPSKRYLEMHERVKKVQRHFLWHAPPVKYDIFHMILHSVWYNRVFSAGPG